MLTHAVITAVTRAATSRLGNPTYRLHLADGRSVLTCTDAAIGYEATNFTPSTEPGVPVTLHLNTRGRVIDITRTTHPQETP